MRLFVASLIALLVWAGPGTVLAEEAQDLERQVSSLLAHGADRGNDPAVLTQLASLYLDLGDELESDRGRQRSAYEAGAAMARRALALQERNAEAHYLYAANAGSAAQLDGVMASALTIQDLKRHVRRALELRPDHAPSLHMMGMMLEELPWVLGGDRDQALALLQRAVATDPAYDHARLDLARAYLKRHDKRSARRELQILAGGGGAPRKNRYAEEGGKLLDELMGREATQRMTPTP